MCGRYVVDSMIDKVLKPTKRSCLKLNGPLILIYIYEGFGGHSGVTTSLASRTFETSSVGNSGSNSTGSSSHSNYSNSSKGLSFKEVLAALVLLTRGTHEEKIKCK